jgi:hypothetical protein
VRVKGEGGMTFAHHELERLARNGGQDTFDERAGSPKARSLSAQVTGPTSGAPQLHFHEFLG